MPRLFAIFFFISGFSALLFETVWFRQLGLILGNGVWSSALTVAGFMAGLALGSALSFRFAHKIARPLHGYAAVELGVAVSGGALVWLFPRLPGLLVPWVQAVPEQGLWIVLIRLSSAFLLLLLPTAAMGCSLPLLAMGLARFESNFARLLGILYGANTLGACVGALIGETVAVSALGVNGTGVLACSTAALASGLAFVVAKRWGREMGDEALGGRAAIPLRLVPLRLTAAAFLAGATLLALEVVWFRFLALFVHEGTLAFAIILAVVLLGISVGGFLAAMWSRVNAEAYRYTFFLFLAAGSSVVFGFIWFDDGSGPYASSLLFPVSDAPTITYLVLRVGFVTCVVSGMIFTFLGRAIQARLNDEAVSSAVLGWSNTVGAMSGALVAGFVLLPNFGMERSFFILAAMYGFTGLLAVSELERPARRVGVLLGCGFVALAAVFPFGLMTNHYLPLVLRPFVADGSQPIAVREGLTETSTYVQKDLWGEPSEFRLVTNGYSMSSSRLASQRYMSLFVTLPMALKPAARDALLISYGLGITAASLVEQSTLSTIDVVDISRDLLDLNRQVPLHDDKHPLDDPRVVVHIEDGRFFLLTTEKYFDLITAEPPPPKNSGIVYLYTREYFSLVYDRLKLGGLATIWLPVYQMEPRESKAIVAAFCGAFDDCSLWAGAGTEWMLVGSNQLERGPTAAGFSRQWSDAVTRKRLRQIGLDAPETLGALFLGDSEFLREWSRNTEPLVDNYPHVIASRTRYSPEELQAFRETYDQVQMPAAAKSRFERSALMERWIPTELREATLRAFDFRDPVVGRFEGRPLDYGAIYHLLAESNQESGVVIALNADPERVAIAKRAGLRGIESPQIDYLLAVDALATRDYVRAKKFFALANDKDPQSLELIRLRLLLELVDDDHSAMPDLIAKLKAAEGAQPNADFWTWFEPALPARPTVDPL